MIYSLFATFTLSKFRKKETIKFLHDNLFFTPAWIISSKTNEDGNYYTSEVMNMVHDNERLSLFDKPLIDDFADNALIISYIVENNLATVNLTSDIPFAELFVDKIFQFYSESDALINCAYFDSIDASNESEIFESNYDLIGKSRENLKFVKHPYLGKIIDTSLNYGRRTLVKGLQLVAASELIFGIESKSIVDFDKLRNLAFAQKVVENHNGSIYIKLFDIVEKADSPQIRKIQERFWKDLDLKIIELNQ